MSAGGPPVLSTRASAVKKYATSRAKRGRDRRSRRRDRDAVDPPYTDHGRPNSSVGSPSATDRGISNGTEGAMYRQPALLLRDGLDVAVGARQTNEQVVAQAERAVVPPARQHLPDRQMRPLRELRVDQPSDEGVIEHHRGDSPVGGVRRAPTVQSTRRRPRGRSGLLAVHDQAVDHEHDDRAADGQEPGLDGEEVLQRALKSRLPRNPPSRAPTTPRTRVTTQPPPFLPGRISLAMAPARRPRRRNPKKPMVCPLFRGARPVVRAEPSAARG